MAEKRIKNLDNEINIFSSGDFIVVDGYNVTSKMSKDNLLKETTEYSVNSGVAARNFTTIDLIDSRYWVDGKVDSSTGELSPDSSRVSTRLFPFKADEVLAFGPKSEGVSFTYTLYCYDKFKRYLGFASGTLSISDAVQDYPDAVWFRLGLLQVSGVTPVSADNIGNIITSWKNPYIYKYYFVESYDAVNEKYVSGEVKRATEQDVDLNDSSNWINGEVLASTGYINPDNHTRLATKMIQFDPTAVLSFVYAEGVSFTYTLYCYDKFKRYLGFASGTLSISDAVQDYPDAVWFRLGLLQVSGVTPVSADNIGNIAIFKKTSSKKYALMSEFLALESSDKLFGKIWYACGDSFTEGAVDDSPMPSGMYAGKKQVYPYFIGNRTGMEVHNIAVSGSTLAYIAGISTAANCFTYPLTGKLYTIPDYAEYITLKFGINDSHQNVPIGTIDDNTNATLYGAWNVAISYILNKCPFAKIGIIVTNGCDSPEYSQAGKDVAKKWGLAYLDENFGYEVPLLHRVNGKPLVCAEAHQNRLENFRVSVDNTHPNNKAHEFESTFVEEWLRTL